MSDFLKKLNILIKAGMNDVLEDVQKAASAPIKHIPRSRLGSQIDSEVNELRAQINKALDYEDELTRKVDEIQRDIDSLDRQADEAVAANDDDRARYFVERLQRAQQRQTMLQADINEHRMATQELILRVNELDATIAEARHREEQAAREAPVASEPPAAASEPLAQRTEVPVEPTESEVATPEAPTPPAQEAPPQPPAEGADKVEGADKTEAEPKPPLYQPARELSEYTEKVLADVIRDARESVARMGDLLDAKTDIQDVVEQLEKGTVSEKIAETQIEDDIAARRSRLSGPAKPPSDPKPSST